MDKVEHSQNRAPHTATEMNFGLRSAGNARLVQHGRARRRSPYPRTAIITVFLKGRNFGKLRPVCRILWNNLPLQSSPLSCTRQHPAQVCHLKCCQSCLCTAVACLRASSLECLFEILGGEHAEGDRYVGLEGG
jgi:hypothetical protein